MMVGEGQSVRPNVRFVGPVVLHANVQIEDGVTVLGPNEVAYLDLVGSGAETVAHLRENGRIVVMFCAFDGPPRIVRLHGRGEVVLPEDERFAALDERFTAPVGPVAHRAVIRFDVTRVGQSCGYGVPLMAQLGEREHQPKWVAKKLRTGGADALSRYQDEKNAVSIDGLPAVPGRA